MYNYNINACRAVAALLVFCFHLNYSFLSGGYIGVDIFFVISGYVISASLIKKIKNKNFKTLIANFFLRRILRILPNILILSIFLILLTKLVFLENHFQEFLRSAIYSNIFVSNFYFWNQEGYFGLENSFKPLLHTWSLSIEAQFYLIFPAIIFLIYKKKFLILLSIIILLSLTSLFVGQLFVDRPFVYYFPIFRIHEFFLGIFIYIYLNIYNKNKINENFVYVGFLIILLTAIYLNKDSSFPGFNSLFPLIGVALIILSKRNSKIEKNKTLQFYGNISYSFYIYHWPIIVLYKYFFLKINFTIFESIIIFLITTFVSYLSYKYVELKFKEYKTENLKKFLFIFISLFFSIFYLIENNKKFITKTEFNKELDFRHNKEKIFQKNKIQNNNGLVFIGDSHSTDLIISISQKKLKNNNLKNLNYINLNDDCLKFILSKKNIIKKIENKIKIFFNFSISQCNQQIDNFYKNLKYLENRKIIIANRWSLESLKYLSDLIKILKINNINNIVIVNRRPFFFNAISLKELTKNKKIDLNSLSYGMNDNQIIKINKKLAELSDLERLKYLNLFNIICDENNKSCNIINKKFEILFIDNDHFSLAGSNFFSDKIIKELNLE